MMVEAGGPLCDLCEKIVDVLHEQPHVIYVGTAGQRKFVHIACNRVRVLDELAKKAHEARHNESDPLYCYAVDFRHLAERLDPRNANTMWRDPKRARPLGPASHAIVSLDKAVSESLHATPVVLVTSEFED